MCQDRQPQNTHNLKCPRGIEILTQTKQTKNLKKKNVKQEKHINKYTNNKMKREKEKTFWKIKAFQSMSERKLALLPI